MVSTTLTKIVVVAATTSAVTGLTSTGWYKCPLVTNGEEPVTPEPTAANKTSLQSDSHIAIRKKDKWMDIPNTKAAGEGGAELQAECIVYDVPLCYEGICDSKKTIKNFVKRIPAKNPVSKKALWVMQGGPGASSVSMESLMESAYTDLNGEFALYTMDHRGVGRSELLACKDGKVTHVGDPKGNNLPVSEANPCLDDLQNVYGDNAIAFGVTSAAKDLVTVSNEIQKDGEWYLYGVSYGTLLVERTIHVATPNFKGFIVDSVQPEFFPNGRNSLFSNWDTDYGDIASRLLKKCTADKYCNGRMGGDIEKVIENLYKALDDPRKKCDNLRKCREWLVHMNTPNEPVSWSARKLLGGLFMSDTMRFLIAPITHRLERCSAADLTALKAFEKFYEWYNSPSANSVELDSSILYKLIVYSEIWERPTPTEADLIKKFLTNQLASGNYGEVDSYCQMTGGRDDACKSLNLTYTKGFSFKPDQYFNVTATIPKGASVLVMGGGLDPQTPDYYAELEYNNLVGSSKRLVHFPIAAHGTVWTTPVQDPNARPCGHQVLISYLKANGDVQKVDETCQADIKPLTFQVPAEFSSQVFNVTDAFDGK